MKKFILILFLLASFTTAKSQEKQPSSYSFESLFQPIDTLFITNNEQSLLSSPIDLCFQDSTLIWGEKNRYTTFTHLGSLLNQTMKSGRGPGEYQKASSYSCDDKSVSFSVLDQSLSKISFFRYEENEQTYLFDYEFIIPSNRPKNFTYTNTFFVTLNELMNPELETPAITIYSKDGNKIKTIGEIPINANLQFYIGGGGGITKDNLGNIYYSYLGDHKIWKWNSEEDIISVFNQKPSYFVSPDSLKVTTKFNSAIEIIRYAYEITRVTGLFFVEPDLIIQQLEPDNYLKEGAQQNVLIEVFDTQGSKKYTSIKLPNTIAFTTGELIYIPVDFYYNMLEKEGTSMALIGYKLKTKKTSN